MWSLGCLRGSRMVSLKSKKFEGIFLTVFGDRVWGLWELSGTGEGAGAEGGVSTVCIVLCEEVRRTGMMESVMRRDLFAVGTSGHKLLQLVLIVRTEYNFPLLMSNPSILLH